MLNVSYIANCFEYGIGVIFLNVFVYLTTLVLLFCLLLHFDFLNFLSLNELNKISTNKFFTGCFVFVFLCFAGVPPLLPFTGKLLLFSILTLNTNLLFLIIFIFLNSFLIFYYIQNLRFLVRKSWSSNRVLFLNYVYNNFWLNFFVLNLIFINTVGVYLLADCLIYINSIMSFIWI